MQGVPKQYEKKNKVHRVVLTGGPCGGKTTVQARLTTFFENLGWKVYQVPETATILLKGGVRFSQLTANQVYVFQKNLIQTMKQIEQTYFDLAEETDSNVLVLCDRGVMDATCYMPQEDWLRMQQENGWDETVDKYERYQHIIHLVTAADGAEEFYQTENNETRTEGLNEAVNLDRKVQKAWNGHPYYDIVDNSTDFEKKINRVIQCVGGRLGIDVRDRFANDSRKRKWLVERTDNLFSEDFPVQYSDFLVVHSYLDTNDDPNIQVRIRARGTSDGKLMTYQLTYRKEVQHQRIETRTILAKKDYQILLHHRDVNHYTVEMTRRCFSHNNQYYQLDVYQEPHDCRNICLLTTFVPESRQDIETPPFITVIKDVTHNPDYSMFRLSLKPVVRPQIFRSNSDVLDECRDQQGLEKASPPALPDLDAANKVNSNGNVDNGDSGERQQRSARPMRASMPQPAHQSLSPMCSTTSPTSAEAAMAAVGADEPMTARAFSRRSIMMDSLHRSPSAKNKRRGSRRSTEESLDRNDSVDDSNNNNNRRLSRQDDGNGAARQAAAATVSNAQSITRSAARPIASSNASISHGSNASDGGGGGGSGGGMLSSSFEEKPLDGHTPLTRATSEMTGSCTQPNQNHHPGSHKRVVTYKDGRRLHLRKSDYPANCNEMCSDDSSFSDDAQPKQPPGTTSFIVGPTEDC